MKAFAYALLFCLLHTTVLGSWGDIDPNFQKCIANCNSQRCKLGNTGSTIAMTYVPPHVMVSLECSDLCLFGCIEETSAIRTSAGHPQVKYFGHWRFIRYFGLEEPASVVFSVLNALPHMVHLVRSLVSRERVCFMTRWMQAYACVACVAWISSSIYHARKTPTSTHLDLITALGFIASGLFIAARRIRGTSAQPLRVTLFLGLLLVGWATRAYYMLLNNVSFNSHMVLSIGMVVVTTLLWVGWILHTLLFVSNKSEGQAKYLCLVCQIWLIVASALEIFDFPPIWGIYDAHALWHASTVPLGFLWYRFWALDKAVRIAAEDAALKDRLAEGDRKAR